MRELRDRAANLYLTVGPSPLNTPVNADGTAYVTVKPSADSLRRFRQAFCPRPAPTTRAGRALEWVARRIASWL